MVTCKYDTIENKVLMHSWIWCPQGNLGTIPSQIARDTVIRASLDPSLTVVTNTQADPMNNVTFVPARTDLLVPVPHRPSYSDVSAKGIWSCHRSALLQSLCWGSSLSKNKDLSSTFQKEAAEGKDFASSFIFEVNFKILNLFSVR